MSSPFVSVVIAGYEAGRFLRATLASALAQIHRASSSRSRVARRPRD